MEFFDEDDAEEELQRSLAEQSVTRTNAVFAIKSCLASGEHRIIDELFTASHQLL